LTVEEESIVQRARSMAAIAADAHLDTARYLSEASQEDWNGPTGCIRWNLRTLSGHILGEAVWFPNLVRGATRDEPPLPGETWETLKRLSPGEMVATLQRAARDLQASIDEADAQELQLSVDLGWTAMPIWRASYIALSEAVYHNWDARVGQDPKAVIPTPWATALAGMAHEVAPMVAHANAASAASGTYLLEVGDGVGAVTVQVEGGHVSMHRGSAERPDVTLHLTADQYDRLIYGRLPLAPAMASGGISVQGDRAHAEKLNALFAGVGGSEG
jgi:uncharacterized protein (TIGR03083 family)